MTFFKKLNILIVRSLDPNDPIGVKRVALLLCLMYFILSSFAITIIGGVLSFRASKGDIAFVNVYSIQTALVMKYNFLIVSFLIGAITFTDFGKIMVEKQEATAPDVVVEEGGDATIVQNAEVISPVEDVKAQNVGVVNTNTIISSTIEEPKPD